MLDRRVCKVSSRLAVCVVSFWGGFCAGGCRILVVFPSSLYTHRSFLCTALVLLLTSRVSQYWLFSQKGSLCSRRRVFPIVPKSIRKCSAPPLHWSPLKLSSYTSDSGVDQLLAQNSMGDTQQSFLLGKSVTSSLSFMLPTNLVVLRTLNGA